MYPPWAYTASQQHPVWRAGTAGKAGKDVLMGRDICAIRSKSCKPYHTIEVLTDSEAVELCLAQEADSVFDICFIVFPTCMISL